MTEYLNIEDKTVLITGDTLELSLKIAEEFALEDSRIAVTTNQENYEKVSQHILKSMMLKFYMHPWI